ncbi:Thioesterase/thiol ester dehydrase-isomerase [Xylariaceae sp. FL0255]|nr:Thioesterase/thiol ester dehydrase-isomerase [Xylariaceae sp. FL0255]
MTLSAIEMHVAVVPAHDLGQDVFTNERPLKSQQAGRTVFGGLLVSQAVSAASATVPNDFHVNSSQSSWLRAVTEKANGKVAYHVERTSDGRSYAMRMVRVMADDAWVYVAMILFQNNKQPVTNSLTYDEEMPELASNPDDIPQERSVQFTASRTNQSGGSMEPFRPDDAPFDWRLGGFEFSNKQTEVRVRGYVRATQSLSTNTPAINLAGLAYASDHTLAGMAAAANPMAVGKGGCNVALIASLTHNVHFLNPMVQIREWMVTERRTTWGANGRVLVHQLLWDWKTGRLVMSVDQEALIRLKSPFKM